MKTRLGIGILCVILIGLCAAANATASEVYVLRFRTPAVYRDPPCFLVAWQDEVLFRNVTSSDLTVRNLASTAGAARPPGQLTVPAGRTASTLGGDNLRLLGGDPFGNQLLVNRLDVPDGVVIASRADVHGPPDVCNAPAGNDFQFGSFPLPVFRALVPANQPQVHLPIDLGVHRRHTNVIVYNAGAVAAVARIEVRMGCDESLLQTTSVSIASDAVVEVGGLTESDPLLRSCSGFGLTTDFTRYVVVTVDQPSFSHALTVSDEFATPTIGVTSP